MRSAVDDCVWVSRKATTVEPSQVAFQSTLRQLCSLFKALHLAGLNYIYKGSFFPFLLLSLDHVECPLEFDQGEFEDGCAGKPGDVCIVSCPAGFTNRVATVTCMMSGEWDEDLSTVCEGMYLENFFSVSYLIATDALCWPLNAK